MDEKQRKQRKPHPVHPKETVVKGPGAPAWLAKSHLTGYSIFLFINATMYERLGGHETVKTMSTTWVLSRSVSLKDPKRNQLFSHSVTLTLKISPWDFCNPI